MKRKSSTPRVVVVTRPSEYELLLHRHATHGQAAFFLERRDQDISVVQARHEVFLHARARAMEAIPKTWRRSIVSRGELDRFLFEPDDVVVAVGQDGLVANLAKYLDGQTVVGINPDPARYDGVLVPHPPSAATALIRDAGSGRCKVQPRTMVRAGLDDGQSLLALNEIFIGHRSHQSARYRLRSAASEERHSSSGVIVATGTGATGWARSIARQRACDVPLPRPEEKALTFFVREAFPSVATGTSLTEGTIDARGALRITSELDDGGVVFGDGIEDDFLAFSWGMTVEVRVASVALQLAA